MVWKAMWRPRILVCGLVIALTSLLSHCTGLTVTRVSKSYIDVKPMENTLQQGVVKMQRTDDVRRGRLILGGRNFRPSNETLSSVDGALKSSNGALEVEADYQSDMGWEEPDQLKGQVYGTVRPAKVAERLMQMEPTVECDEGSMKLNLHGMGSTTGPPLCVDRGYHHSPMPLSQLPASCGYTLRSTRRDMTLVAPYDGCHVTLEEGYHVLPLCWLGLQMRMCCPATKPPQPKPPTVSCYADGMVVKIQSATSDEISVKFNGQWHPLMMVSPQCGFSVVAHPEGVVLSADYEPCVETKDGMFTLEMAFGGEMKLSCPDINRSTGIPRPSPPVDPETLSKPVPSPQSPINPEPAPPVHLNYPNPWGLYPPFPTPMPHQVPLWTPDAVDPVPPSATQKPKDVTQYPQGHYFPFYPNSFEPHPKKPTPAAEAPKGDGKEVVDDRIYYLPENPETYPIQKPTPGVDAPKGQVDEPWNPYPLYPQPAKPHTPTATIQKPSPPAEAPKGEAQPPFYNYPFYVPEKPETSPTQKPAPSTDDPKGQVDQPWYPYPPYPQPAKPHTPTATVQKPSPPVEAPKGEVQPPFYHYPFYPLPEKPETSHTPKPAPSTYDPKGQVDQPWYPYPPYPQPAKPHTPTATVQKPSPPVEAPKGEVQPPFYHYPFYLPEKPETSPTPKPAPSTDDPKGQVDQPWYPYPPYHQPAKPHTPTATVQKPSPPVEAPKGEVQPPFYNYPFYLPEKPETSPTHKPAPSTDDPKGQVDQPWYPYPPYPQPAKPHTPTATVQKPSPPAEGPKGEVQPPFYNYPFYLPEKPETSPTQKPAPSTDDPKGQVDQPWYPYPPYPQPAKPHTPTATVQKPSPPVEAPKGEVQPPFYHYPFYPLPEKPETSHTPKPAPSTYDPKGQVDQPWYPYPPYPQPAKPHTPTATVQKPSPPVEAPKGEVQPPFYHYPFYPLPEKPETSHTPKPAPSTYDPKGQVDQPWYPYPPYPQPAKPHTPTATIQKPSPPAEGPKGEVQPPFYHYPFYPLPEKPETSHTPKPGPSTDDPKGQVDQPWYPYPPYPQPPKPQPLPTQKPSLPMPGIPVTASQKPTPVAGPPDGQLYPYFFPYPHQPQTPKPVIPSTDTQPPPPYEPKLTEAPKPTVQLEIQNIPYPPGYCPPACPTGFSNCCPPQGYCPPTCPAGFSNCCPPPISYHQHYHHTVQLPATVTANEPAATPHATKDSNKPPYLSGSHHSEPTEPKPPLQPNPYLSFYRPLEPARQPIDQGYRPPPKYLSDQAPATDLFSMSGAQPPGEPLKPKTPTHGKPQPPPNKPNKQLSDVLRAYSKRHSGVQKQNSPGQETPAHASPLNNPTPNLPSPQPQELSIDSPIKSHVHEFPPSFQHYWKPIMAQGSFQKVPISHLTRPSRGLTNRPRKSKPNR